MRVLADLKEGDEAIIVKVKGKEPFRRKVMDMGFVGGTKIKVVHKAPMKDPVIYSVLGCNISLRNHEAEHIEVVDVNEMDDVNGVYSITDVDGEHLSNVRNYTKVINVALVGNYNSGKTTLFNSVTRLNEKTANYSGTTHESKSGSFQHKGYTINVVDLPGVNSFAEGDENALYVRNYIIDNLPDVIIDVVNSNSLERGFYLTLQLVDMHYRSVVALNFYDEFEKSEYKFDYTNFGRLLGVPMVAISAEKRSGLESLFDRVISVYEDRDPDSRHVHVMFNSLVEQSIERIHKVLEVESNYEFTDHISNRYMAIKLLEGDAFEMKRIREYSNYDKIRKVVEREQQRVRSLNNNEEVADIFAVGRYSFLHGALKETLQLKDKNVKKSKSWAERIDDTLVNKYFGIPIFLFFMWLMFQMTFVIGAYPSDLMAIGLEYISGFLSTTISDGWFRSMLIDGAFNGMAGVIVFLPNILILFLFISLLEDTGYMSRVVFMMDKLMHRIGLHGKSLVPMIMGFGCNVPAVLASKMIENKKDRLVTIFINPFMSCSGRFPLYVLFIGAFFAGDSGLMLLTVYGVGVVVAILTAILLRKTIVPAEDSDFVMELPPYRLPNWKAVLYSMWFNTKEYLQKIIGVVLIGAVIIWGLGYFPRGGDGDNKYTEMIKQAEITYTDNIGVRDSVVNAIQSDQEQARLSNSYIASIGKFIEPVLRPLGFDWKMGIVIISGIPAKEITVGTMGVLYHSDDIPSELKDGSVGLSNTLRQQVYLSGENAGKNVFNTAVALSFMIFILLYIPCLATVSAIARELSWWWAIFSVVYSLVVAWMVSFAVYNIALWFM